MKDAVKKYHDNPLKDYKIAARHKLAEEIMAYAKEHYSEGGWDIVVECYSIDDIVADLEYFGSRIRGPGGYYKKVVKPIFRGNAIH